MIITSLGSTTALDTELAFEWRGVRVVWDGFLYVPGFVAGEESIKRLASMLDLESESVPHGFIRGAFFVAVFWPSGKVTVFNDNSGMNATFVSSFGVSNRLLSLIRHLRKSTNASLTLCTEALAQNYAIGRVLDHHTPIAQISVLDKAHFVEILDGDVRIRDKGVPDIDEKSEGFDVSEFFDHLAMALSTTRTSVALTGGYDSRLVLAFLNRRMCVDPTLSGDNDRHPDVVVATKVANAINRDLVLIRAPKPNDLNDEEIDRVFRAYDGLCGFDSDASFRLEFFFKTLRERGVRLHVTGDGGVLHKDWEWMQDLPFYRKPATDLGRFYDQRLGFNFDATGAGVLISDVLAEFRHQTMKRLEQHVRAINTESYDMLYYHVNGRRTLHYNAKLGGFQSYAPLLERDFVAYSYSLPRSRRFFNNNMRRLTTEQDPAVARIPTVYGTTASHERRFIVRDLGFQLVDYARKGIRLFGRKALKRNLFVPSIVLWSAREEIRSLDVTLKAFEFCRNIGLIAADSTIDSLSPQHIAAVLHTFKIAEEAGLEY